MTGNAGDSHEAADGRAGTETADVPGAWLAVSILTLFQVVDGFDLVSLSLTASSIRKEWPIPDGLLGTLLAAAQFGAVFAAMVVGRLSDAFGLRRMLVAAGLLMAAGSAVTALAENNGALLLARVVTGIGVGGALPLTIGYIGRNLPQRNQPIAIIIVTSGLAIGQMIAGVAAAPVVETYGWRSMFWTGTFLSLAVIPVLFLLRRDELAPRRTQQQSAESQIPARSGSGLRYLWRSGHRKAVAIDLLLCCNGSIVFYFLVSWMPVILQKLGMELSSASLATTFLSAGGLVGSFIVGPLVGKAPFKVVGGCFAIAGLLLGAIALVPVPVIAILASCLILGLTLSAAYISMGVFMTTVFPPRSHVHISGISTVVSRTGGMAGPVMAGTLLGAGIAEKMLFLIAAVLVASAGLITITSGRRIASAEKA